MKVGALPDPIPMGWMARTLFPSGLPMLCHREASGLYATYTTEIYGPDDEAPFGAGHYRRLVLSRKTYDPTLAEMQQFIAACGLFEIERPVLLLVRFPKPGHTLTHSFHFLQKDVEVVDAL